MPLLYLDSNVLLPLYLRCVFLELASVGLVSVHWSRQILAEVRRNLLKPRHGQTETSVDRLLSSMTHAFPEALVSDNEELEPRFHGKTDPKDAHVAAGALRLALSPSASDREVLLVTANLKHLPAAAFAGTRVHPAGPDAVLRHLLTSRPEAADVLAGMVQRYRAPSLTQRDLLGTLDRTGCSGFATALGKAWGYAA